MPAPLRGLDSASLASQPLLRMSATLHFPGEGERETGPGPHRGSRAPDPTLVVEQPGLQEEGAPQLLQAGCLSGDQVRSRPGCQAPRLAGQALSEWLCGRLGSAIFFLLPGWASLGGPEVRVALPPPCLYGKFLRPREGGRAEEGRRRVRQGSPPPPVQDRRPGGSCSGQGCCKPSLSPPGWPRGGAWRWEESGPNPRLGVGGGEPGL